MTVLFIFLYRMWNQFVKDYLTFSKKERVAVLVLLVLIFFVLLLPYLWPAKKMIQPDNKAMEELKAQLEKITKSDSFKNANQESEENVSDGNGQVTKGQYNTRPAMFYFDPNTLPAEGWKRLGLREKTIQTIQNYLSKGGKFKRPEDIGRVYGLFKDDYERLLPYIKLRSENVADNDGHTDKPVYVAAKKNAYSAKISAAVIPIDINTADTTALIALPGIGSKLASRIINFREKLGGFYSVTQLAETYGLPDSTFQKIQYLLQCPNPTLHQININTADVNILKAHPYIRWSIANAIIQYRKQHGNFKSVDDLQQVAIIPSDVFLKIKPYMSIE
jgi:competence protein ComEA